MILDSLDNRDCYEAIPGLKEILDVMASIHKENMIVETLVIDGEKAFINPVTFTTKDITETCFEAHRKYADIHCVVDGTEGVIVRDVRKVKEIQAYADEKDVGFYRSTQGTVCVLKPGDFLVCFPQDAHRVAIAPGKPGEVIKLVGKLRVNV